jgi:hypothetical protein
MPSLTGSPPIANTIGIVLGTTGLAAAAGLRTPSWYRFSCSERSETMIEQRYHCVFLARGPIAQSLQEFSRGGRHILSVGIPIDCSRPGAFL